VHKQLWVGRVGVVELHNVRSVNHTFQLGNRESVGALGLFAVTAGFLILVQRLAGAVGSRAVAGLGCTPAFHGKVETVAPLSELLGDTSSEGEGREDRG
jgi:hypothetical protein